AVRGAPVQGAVAGEELVGVVVAVVVAGVAAGLTDLAEVPAAVVLVEQVPLTAIGADHQLGGPVAVEIARAHAVGWPRVGALREAGGIGGEAAAGGDRGERAVAEAKVQLRLDAVLGLAVVRVP